MTHYLVTGGAGFIGSHVAEALVRRGDKVRVLDNLSMGNRENLSHLGGDLELVVGDVEDPEAVRGSLAGIEVVFHQAALASVPLSVTNPLASHAACATGTLNLLNEARLAGVRRVVYASSSALYGDQPTSAKRETDVPSPLTPYGVAKLAGEYYCHAAWHTYGLETVCLRYFNVFGPRQDPQSPYSAVIPLFITAMLQGKSPTVYGDGRQSRDFTYVQNVVAGNLLAADVPGIAGQSFNLANGRATDLLTLIEALNELLGTNMEPSFQPARAGDIRDSMADITLARQVLSYEPPIDFHTGLRQSVDYYRSLVEVG
jgi:UDP-glucose 4-epimerase